MKDYPVHGEDGKWYGVPVPVDFDTQAVTAVYFPKDPKSEALLVVSSHCVPNRLGFMPVIAIDDDSQVFRATTKCKQWTEQVSVMPLRDVADERAAAQYRLETFQDILAEQNRWHLHRGIFWNSGGIDSLPIPERTTTALVSNVPLDHPAFRLLKSDWRAAAERVEKAREINFWEGDEMEKFRFIAARGGGYARETYLKCLYLASKLQVQMEKEFQDGCAIKDLPFTYDDCDASAPDELWNRNHSPHQVQWNGIVQFAERDGEPRPSVIKTGWNVFKW